jgi:hypothetical protein
MKLFLFFQKTMWSLTDPSSSLMMEACQANMELYQYCQSYQNTEYDPMLFFAIVFNINKQ